MADIIDVANDSAEILLAATISTSRKPEGPQPTGLCLFCEEELEHPKRWCDSFCRDTWEHEEKFKK